TWKDRLELHDAHAVFDVTADVHRLTLDAISMTMFSYDLSTGKRDIPNLLAKITHSPPDGAADILLGSLAEKFPAILKLPSSMKQWCDNLRGALGEIAREVWSGREGIGMHAKLVNALAKENTPEDVTIAQIIGIIFAGSETTANVITVCDQLVSTIRNTDGAQECLFELAKHPHIQHHLRTELSSFEVAHGRQPTYEDFTNTSALPYLDALTRETLRTKAVLTTISRVAVRDDVIPLEFPIKDELSGRVRHEVEVKAGSLIDIPVRDGINVNKAIWGPGAEEFSPERWMNPGQLPESVSLIRAQGHILTFGDGSKVCLGRSFAIGEFKIVVSHLVRNLAFELDESVELDFYHVGGNTIKPMVRGREGEGAQMPLIVSLVPVMG
ncbi:hypothetical protein V5O48_004585, partial [Marasmius crinis-equi]